MEITRNVSEKMNITKITIDSEDFSFTDHGLQTMNQLINKSSKISIPVYKTCEHVLFIALAIMVSYSMSYFIASSFDKKDLTDLIKGKIFFFIPDTYINCNVQKFIKHTMESTLLTKQFYILVLILFFELAGAF